MKSLKSISSLFALAALFSMVFIVGCQKDAMETDPATDDTWKMEANTVIIMGPDGFQKVAMEELQDFSGQVSTRNNGNGNNGNNGNSHINAHFSTQPSPAFKNATLQLNATENNQGVNGTGIAWVTQLTATGAEYSYQMITKPECMFTDGNEAVWVGIIEEIIGETPGFPYPGLKVVIKVIDNGQGANAPADQYNPQIIFLGPAWPCNLFPLGHPAWNTLPDLDVLNASDNIKVN